MNLFSGSGMSARWLRAAVFGLALGSAIAFSVPARAVNLHFAAQKALDAFCALNVRYIELLFDATRTSCHIVRYREGLMVVLTAEQPVFRNASARRAWAIVTVSAAGKTIRDQGGSLLGIDYVGLTDSEEARAGKLVRLPASYAEKIQAEIHDGKIDVATAVENLDSQLRLER